MQDRSRCASNDLARTAFEYMMANPALVTWPVWWSQKHDWPGSDRGEHERSALSNVPVRTWGVSELYLMEYRDVATSSGVRGSGCSAGRIITIAW